MQSDRALSEEKLLVDRTYGEKGLKSRATTMVVRPVGSTAKRLTDVHTPRYTSPSPTAGVQEGMSIPFELALRSLQRVIYVQGTPEHPRVVFKHMSTTEIMLYGYDGHITYPDDVELEKRRGVAARTFCQRLKDHTSPHPSVKNPDAWGQHREGAHLSRAEAVEWFHAVDPRDRLAFLYMPVEEVAEDLSAALSTFATEAARLEEVRDTRMIVLYGGHAPRTVVPPKLRAFVYPIGAPAEVTPDTPMTLEELREHWDLLAKTCQLGDTDSQRWGQVIERFGKSSAQVFNGVLALAIIQARRAGTRVSFDDIFAKAPFDTYINRWNDVG